MNLERAPTATAERSIGVASREPTGEGSHAPALHAVVLLRSSRSRQAGPRRGTTRGGVRAMRIPDRRARPATNAVGARRQSGVT